MALKTIQNEHPTRAGKDAKFAKKLDTPLALPPVAHFASCPGPRNGKT